MFADLNIAGNLCYSGILWKRYSRSMDSHKFHKAAMSQIFEVATFMLWNFYFFSFLTCISMFANLNIRWDLCYLGILWKSCSRSTDFHKFHKAAMSQIYEGTAFSSENLYFFTYFWYFFDLFCYLPVLLGHFLKELLLKIKFLGELLFIFIF